MREKILNVLNSAPAEGLTISQIGDKITEETGEEPEQGEVASEVLSMEDEGTLKQEDMGTRYRVVPEGFYEEEEA